MRAHQRRLDGDGGDARGGGANGVDRDEIAFRCMSRGSRHYRDNTARQGRIPLSSIADRAWTAATIRIGERKKGGSRSRRPSGASGQGLEEQLGRNLQMARTKRVLLLVLDVVPKAESTRARW